MTDLDLEAIKARAKMATPGPWRVTEEGITNLTPDKDEHDQIAEIVTMHPSDVALLEISDEDAAHIAGMDPETTLALVSHIEELRAENLELNSLNGAGNALAELREAMPHTLALVETIVAKRSESEDE